MGCCRRYSTKSYLQSRILRRTVLEPVPQAEEEVRNIFNKVAVEKEVLNKDMVTNGG